MSDWRGRLDEQSGGSELRREFDDALLAVQEDGEFDRLKQKWFDTGG